MVENQEKFYSIEDLYKRLLPAIKTKLDEFKRENINNVNELDIWNYCMQNKWNNRKDIRLYEMVSDILEIDIFNLNIYKNKINNE